MPANLYGDGVEEPAGCACREHADPSGILPDGRFSGTAIMCSYAVSGRGEVNMSDKLKTYVVLIIVSGVLLTMFTLSFINTIDIWGVVTFTVLSVIAESLLIPTRDERAISVGFAVALTSILVLGVAEAIWVSSIGIMFRVFRLGNKRVCILNYPFYKTLFNGANVALSTGIAGLCYISMGGIPGDVNINTSILPMIISILIYIITNAAIISCLMSIISQESYIAVWYKNIIWVIKDYLAMAPLGIIMAAAYLNYGILGVSLFFVPLLFARYSFKLYIDMRNIYIDTVKSLSQAMEAKDPYTQGHSMRVSEYACALAEELSLPQRRVENLKIAAMLHDIGKLGIEESILNKPGKLTTTEYEKIKQHPEIGVKIIKEIDFLKDASTIIMHHHERIDGMGYPKGISGNDICMESCILSVADVYDALTSDRPYRPALNEVEALNVIDMGKGTQFDTKVADTFIKMMQKRGE